MENLVISLALTALVGAVGTLFHRQISIRERVAVAEAELRGLRDDIKSLTRHQEIHNRKLDELTKATAAGFEALRKEASEDAKQIGERITQLAITVANGHKRSS